MAKNIFQQQVTPEKPKVLSEERIYVYMPTATGDQKGMASFNPKDFSAPNGRVSLRWPLDMLVQDLADPTIRPSMTKVLPDEFRSTLVNTKIINPITGIEYTSPKAEIKLNRENRNAQIRPDLVMLSDEFEPISTTGPNNESYNMYRIKRQNPLTTPTITQLHSLDFNYTESLVEVNWPLAHNPVPGNKVNDYGLVKIGPNHSSNLNFDNQNRLQVDLNQLKISLSGHLATRPLYGEANIANWPDRDIYLNTNTGLAKRDAQGNTLLSLTKEAIGLSKLDNRNFTERQYAEFSEAMKSHFDIQFGLKLNRDLWDGPNGAFRDWQPLSNETNTVQKWFRNLEEEDNSLWNSISTLRKFLGFFQTPTELNTLYPPKAILFGTSAYVASTDTYWSVSWIDNTRYDYRFREHDGIESITGMTITDRAINLDTGEEYIWDGTSWIEDGTHDEAWQWYDTLIASPSFFDQVETDANNLKPNAPVASVSVGSSGKWLHSDHVHPSDPSKINVKVLEDAQLTITTNSPGTTDFLTKLVKTKLLNHEGQELNIEEYAIVDTVAELSSIPDPQLDDKAFVRYTSSFYQYTGTIWNYTGFIGQLIHNSISTINLPYVKTGQYLHNWKSNPFDFTQNANTNEAYWAGNVTEFEDLDLSVLPDGSLVVVTDDEYYEPRQLVLVSQIDEAGLTLEDDETTTTERFVIVDNTDSLYGKLLTVVTEEAIEGVKGARHKLVELNLGALHTVGPTGHRMAITVPTEDGGTTLANRAFNPDRMLQSDTNGNIDSTLFVANNLVKTGLYDIPVQLTPGRVVIAGEDNTVSTWNPGSYPENRVVVVNSAGGLTSRPLAPSRLVTTGPDSELLSIPWYTSNIIRSSASVYPDEVEVELSINKVVISSIENTVKTWSSGGVKGSVITRGTEDGQIEIRTNTAINRVLVTGADGTLVELPAGNLGQILASGGSNAPGWIDSPTAATHLPQTKFTTNPDEITANALQGIVAVILNAPIPTDQMRNNCIYYF